jgi:hypothetical protein
MFTSKLKLALLTVLFAFWNNLYSQGSLAICNGGGVGLSSNFETLEQAQRNALIECTSGGKIVDFGNFTNSCIAVSVDKKNGKSGWAKDKYSSSQAQHNAIVFCKKEGGENCEIIAQACDNVSSVVSAKNDKCANYGFNPGSEAYASCLMQQDMISQQQSQQLINNGLKMLNGNPVTTCYPNPGVPNSAYCVK